MRWSRSWFPLSQASKEGSKPAQSEDRWGHIDCCGLDLVVLSTVLLAKGSSRMVLLHRVVAFVVSSLYNVKDIELLLPAGLMRMQTPALSGMAYSLPLSGHSMTSQAVTDWIRPWIGERMGAKSNRT